MKALEIVKNVISKIICEFIYLITFKIFLYFIKTLKDSYSSLHQNFGNENMPNDPNLVSEQTGNKTFE